MFKLGAMHGIEMQKVDVPQILTELPDSAGRDFYAGGFFGWLGEDIKAEMETCFPADPVLSQAVDDMMAAELLNDWDAAREALGKASL